jgi:hypothetical protein
MCFGNAQTSTQTTTPSTAVTSAANSNLGFVNQLQSNGFQPYTGQQVANLAPAQQATIDATQNIANNGTGTAASNLIGGYASAPAQSVTPQTIASNMSPYMNLYVMQALAPQLQQADVQDAKTRAATNATATGSGAFGDARTGIEQANNAFNSNVAREGLIGSAYNSAFNTAIGAGAQDSANNLTGQTTNANLAETALNRSLGGAQALEGLQTQQQGVQTTANTAAQQDTAQQQAQLTAQYNQWLMAQQYPFQTAGLMNSTVAAANPANPTTSTLTQPDSSGYAMLGTALGVAGGVALGGGSLLPGVAGTAIGGSSGPTSYGGSSGPTPLVSDARLKEDINLIGGLHDGTPVFSYSYKGDPHKRKQIGLMAQDLKTRMPESVITLPDAQGTMLVDYAKATEKSRLMSMAV